MRNILSESHIEMLNDRGLLTLSIPFELNLGKNSIYHNDPDDDAIKALTMYAMAWLRSQYTLNWSDVAMILDFKVSGNSIDLKLINSEMLQLVLMETGIGLNIFNELAKMPSVVLN